MKPKLDRSSYAAMKLFSSTKLDAGDDTELQEMHRFVSDSHAAPNLSLNVGTTRTAEVRVFAVVAVLLQAGVLVFDVFSTRNSRLSTSISDGSVPAAGLPLTLTGTL